MFAGLTGWHLLIILAVILLLFGATRLPALAKSVGQSTRIFKKEMKEMQDENADDAKGGDAAAGSSTSSTQSNQPKP
ncbi:MAG TPA: Sec-independent protein translocase subunit TatA [Humibacter sp.]|jgi:sec-independent protein translocase protein TatA|nr:Sec-independent protein translocase subunit TatA [Humibacter sp.]